MAEISQGKKYGHEINFHGPYLDGQINLNFHVVSSSEDQITTIKEIADLIREDGTIPATGNYTYYEKQEEKKEVEKKEEIEETKDESSVATPRPIMKTVTGIQVDGDGIKPIFTKEENSVEPKIMMMSLESASASDEEIIYPTILSADAPAVLADSSDDSKLITFGNLKTFAGLTDARYALNSDVIKKGTLNLYRHRVTITNNPLYTNYTIHFIFELICWYKNKFTKVTDIYAGWDAIKIYDVTGSIYDRTSSGKTLYIKYIYMTDTNHMVLGHTTNLKPELQTLYFDNDNLVINDEVDAIPTVFTQAD